MESVEKSAEKVPCEDVSQVHLQACLDERNDVGETIHVPSDDEGVIDPRLKDYPVTMVARTVHLHNDPTQVLSRITRPRSRVLTLIAETLS